jgi:hypothetical protein
MAYISYGTEANGLLVHAGRAGYQSQDLSRAWLKQGDRSTNVTYTTLTHTKHFIAAMPLFVHTSDYQLSMLCENL